MKPLTPTQIATELQAIRELYAEADQRTSSLQQKLAPVQGRASNKKIDPVRRAVERRNRQILKRSL
jgi:hypothetical protein